MANFVLLMTKNAVSGCSIHPTWFFVKIFDCLHLFTRIARIVAFFDA